MIWDRIIGINTGLAVMMLIALFALAGAVRAQERPTAGTENDVGGSSGTYRIGIGDVLDIRVYNRPQLSRDAIRVDDRGMIRMPLLSDAIRAACRTDSELASEIGQRYLEYLRNPHVEVFIKEYQSKAVAVIGAVREPGRFLLQRQVRLLDLVAFAGGPTDRAGGRIQVRHDPDVRPCGDRTNDPTGTDVVPAGLGLISEENVSWYEFPDLLKASTPVENPYVRPGDVVNLVEADTVYVVGNVYRPAIIPLKERTTLTQAIAVAGGVLPDTNFDRVTIVRQTPGGTSKTQITVDLKAISKRKADDPILEANDIVDVPTSSGKKFVRALLGAISPTVSRLPLRVIP